MGRDSVQNPLFNTRLADEAYVSLGQIPQAAMEQTTRPATRTGSHVVLFGQANAQTTHGGVAGDSGTDDTAADNKQIERFGCHALDLFESRLFEGNAMHRNGLSWQGVYDQ